MWNSATSLAWSFDHPEHMKGTDEVTLAWEALTERMDNLKQQVKEHGIASISEDILDVFDTIELDDDEAGVLT